jgi:hypothetical protein
MRRSFSRAGFILAAAMLAGGASAVAAGPAALAAPHAPARAPVGRAALASASAADTAGQLHAVAAVSSRDVWAVGCARLCNGPGSLILHWNGTTWSKVASPDPSPGLDTLTGVSVVSADDVWAVGYGCTKANCDAAGNVYDDLILHWNGTKWFTVASPDPSTTQNELFGVTAVSATDVWAAGAEVPNILGAAPMTDTLILHWNGTKWSTVSSPNVAFAANTLYGVDANSATSAWAVGNECDFFACPYPGVSTGTLILHWNGKTWSKVSSPNPGEFNNVLFGVSAVTPDDAWAVGDTSATSPGGVQSLVVHWNGTKWSRVASPNPGSQFNDLQAVSAASAGDIQAAGNQLGPDLPYTTLTEHWNGTAWSAVASPNGIITKPFVNFLSGISAISCSDAIAVGWVQGYFSSSYQVLILRWNGKTWSAA